MTISERILKVLKDRNMTQVEFAKQVGIATSTISEWKKEDGLQYRRAGDRFKRFDVCGIP